MVHVDCIMDGFTLVRGVVEGYMRGASMISNAEETIPMIWEIVEMWNIEAGK